MSYKKELMVVLLLSFVVILIPTELLAKPEVLTVSFYEDRHVARPGAPIIVTLSVSENAEVTVRIFNLRGEVVQDQSYHILSGQSVEWSWYGKNMHEEEINNGLYILRIITKTDSDQQENITKILGVLF